MSATDGGGDTGLRSPRTSITRRCATTRAPCDVPATATTAAAAAAADKPRDWPLRRGSGDVEDSPMADALRGLLDVLYGTFGLPSELKRGVFTDAPISRFFWANECECAASRDERARMMGGKARFGWCRGWYGSNGENL